MKAKIYVNSELLGYCEDPIQFTQEMREKRRNGKISYQMNIAYYENTNEIYIFTDSGRARKPLIIVKDGRPLLKEEHIYKIAHGLLKWDDLIASGIIEFLDADEEENSYIAMNFVELNENHTHLEIDPATMLGIFTGIIPFSNHNSSPRNTMGAGMAKQALGIYVSNYAMRTDTRSHLLHHPQTPIVTTRIIDSTNYDLRPAGQNFVVAVMSYEGYNMEDGLVFNKSSLERGLARSSFFRAYDSFEKRYAGGLIDRFEYPSREIKGWRSYEAYKNLDEDGIINPETYVESGDVLIGKTSHSRFEEKGFGIIADIRKETSLTVRHGEKGIVDAVLLSETAEGSRLAKVRVRDTRQPELGDKFASRHGQKGGIGLVVNPEDIPFTQEGIVPDLIVNPHGMPSRMSVGQILEMVAGKAGALEGKRVDATPFNQTLGDEIKQILINNGFESAGCESLYDVRTGERFEAEILMGIVYYQKLHHMVTDKIYARARGPVQVLTRQPTEGRVREGGLRFGEMERDCLVAHGAALTLKERLLDESDKYEAIVCENCGMLGVFDRNREVNYCPICDDVETHPIEISFAFKLLLDELKSLCIYPKLVLGEKTELKEPFKKKHYPKIKPLEENRNFVKGSRLSDEEPIIVDSKKQNATNCIICGKKLTKTQKNLCKTCSRKQYASRIIKKLVTVVKPGISFKKEDLKSLNLIDLQIKDYIWTLQEFNLVEIDNNKFKLKDEEALNKFRIESKMDSIDFDNLNEEDRLDKVCKICGKTLPISNFYKSSHGYEDYCKECHRLIQTSKYLHDIINYFGFDKEFTNKDLKKHISNENQLMGIIWALQENDLLIEKKMGVYILVDKSICLNFLEKYSPGESSKIIEDINLKSKGSSIVNKSKIDVQNQDSESEKIKYMKIVLNARKKGKTCEEAAELAGIPFYTIVHWYKEGKQGSGKENIQFYKKLNKIEDKLFDLKDSNERKLMEFVLKLLRKGKTKSEVAKLTELNESTFAFWYNQGKDAHSINTSYFYNEMNKINKGNS